MSEKTERTVNIKGNFKTMKADVLLKKKFSDIKYSYGRITFWGTDKDEDEMLDYLVTNEGKFGFKII